MKCNNVYSPVNLSCHFSWQFIENNSISRTYYQKKHFCTLSELFSVWLNETIFLTMNIARELIKEAESPLLTNQVSSSLASWLVYRFRVRIATIVRFSNCVLYFSIFYKSLSMHGYICIWLVSRHSPLNSLKVRVLLGFSSHSLYERVSDSTILCFLHQGLCGYYFIVWSLSSNSIVL